LKKTFSKLISLVMGRIFWNLKFVCIVGVTHADAQIEDLAKDVAGKVAEVGLLVVAGEVLDQHAEMGPALVLANGHLVEVIAKVLQTTALPNLPEEGGQIEHKGLEEQDQNHPLIVDDIAALLHGNSTHRI